VKTLFNTLLSGVIPLVSIVVSINSVVLSQEIGDIEAQEERTSASLEFRRRIEESIESDVTPARPAEFVRVVLYTILHKTNELQEVAADTADDEFQQHVEDLGKKISDDVNRARGILGDAQYRTFRVLLAGLNYDYAGQLPHRPLPEADLRGRPHRRGGGGDGRHHRLAGLLHDRAGVLQIAVLQAGISPSSRAGCCTSRYR